MKILKCKKTLNNNNTSSWNAWKEKFTREGNLFYKSWCKIEKIVLNNFISQMSSEKDFFYSRRD